MEALHVQVDSSPLVLRGHTLLCLQGFRGEGYSPAFIANMAAIDTYLAGQGPRPVRVVAEPDEICRACPHHQAACTLNGADSEQSMQRQDREVLQRLGLNPGAVVSWTDIVERIRTHIAPEQLPDICGACRWLPLGYCAESLDRLRRSAPAFIDVR